MDCEKFESTLIDELYDELDELTSAAAKRHVAGCARCAALLGGLKATRRLAVLPMVTPSADLEDRILAAARDAQKVVPIERRLSRAISWAGSWAMRPQTAMAALFLLMIGSSALFLRGHKASAPSSATMTITAEGSPAASAATNSQAAPDEVAKVDPSMAAAAHGVPMVPTAAAPMSSSALALASPSPAAPAATAPLERARGDEKDKDEGLVAQNSMAKSAYGSSSGFGAAGGGIANADVPPAGAPGHSAPKPSARSVADPSASSLDDLNASQGGGSAGPGRQADGKGQNASPLDSAKALYNAGKYGDAVSAFDALAGDPSAALWAARSTREGVGCAAAIPRFDAVASRSFGTGTGYDAVLEGGRCLHSIGSIEGARSHFTRLLTVPAYMSRAQQEIDALSLGQMASRKAPAPKAASAPPPAKPQQQAPAQMPSPTTKAQEAY